MDIYIPACDLETARHDLAMWGYSRDLPLIDTMDWPWFRTYVFRAPPPKVINATAK